MAFGDLITTFQLPENIPMGLGYGLTVYNAQLVNGSFTNNNSDIGFFDINNNLNYLSHVETEETYQSIQYDEDEHVFWGLANIIPTPFPQPHLQKIYKFNVDGTSIFNFDVHDSIPPADRFNENDWESQLANALSMTPDKTEFWVSYYRAFRIYRFSVAGNYLGFFDIPPENETITGMSTDGTNMWFVTYDFNPDPQRVLTISKRDTMANVLQTITVPVPESPQGGGYNINDIEFDQVNFLPKCALWVRASTGDVGNAQQYAHVYDIGDCSGSCTEPPIIIAENLCLKVGANFDPLFNVQAVDCDGSDIPLTEANVIFNDVDTATPGMYTVTYQVQSVSNDLITVKSIYVGVVEETPRMQAMTDLLASIALEETALSHILNAEGEKIQKALALGLSSAELIKINQSVEDMTEEITNLEWVLEQKAMLCSCENGQPKCDFPQ